MSTLKVISPPLGKAMLFSTDNEGRMNCVDTVAASWVIFHRSFIRFWFRSGSEHDDMKLISVQSSERLCVIQQIWSSIHHQQGSLQFLSLDINQTECQSSAEDPTELPYNISLTRVRWPLGKRWCSCNQEVTLRLMSALLLSFEVAVWRHFETEELVVNCHICSTRVFDWANVIDYDNMQRFDSCCDVGF